MKTGNILALVLAMATLPASANWNVLKAAQVATGFSSHVLCDDIFVSGIDPDTAFDQRLRHLRGINTVAWALRPQVDRVKREVSVSLAGGFTSHSIYREGLGCTAESTPAITTSPAKTQPALLPPIAGTAVVAPQTPALAAALASAFSADATAVHHTKAVLVLRDGKLIGEQYAPGIGVNTPILGFSMSKSLTSALIGVLVQQGRLSLHGPAPIAAWKDPADPRHGITVEQLLRQVSGLDLYQDNSGFDNTSQIMYTAPDKAAASAATALSFTPGTHWAYSDGNFMLLSRLLRDVAGGSAADVNRFAHEQLFDPLGMQGVVMDFDASGTPVGSSHFIAPARDWARLGQLYLDDGVEGGKRLLPPGWVAMSATPTLDTGYGAGFWTNRRPGPVPGWGQPWGLAHAPADAFFARGYMGQFVVVIPSQRIVIVRMSISTHEGDDIGETDRIVGAVLAALAGGKST